MSQIEELQGRITAALDRIGQGLDHPGGGDAEQVSALTAELEEERVVTAQFKERNKKLRARNEELESRIAELEEASEGADAGKTQALDEELQNLREANARLREINAKLREANEAGVGEPHLINNAMMAELEALRAERAADQAEAGAILEALQEAVDSAEDAPKTEDA